MEKGGDICGAILWVTLAALSAAFAVLILLWGVLRLLVGCKQHKWGCTHLDFFVLTCLVAFAIHPSSLASSLVHVFFTFLVFSLVVVSSAFNGLHLHTFEARGGDASVVLTMGAFLAQAFGGIVWE